MKHFVVINPHSFKTSLSLNSLVKKFETCFEELELEYDIYLSRFPRDGVAAVNRFIHSILSDEKVRVYAVGGDGILFDCLNGMAPYPNAELTCVPYGKANDFIRAFGEDAYLAFQDLKRLATGPSFPVDIFFCGNNYMINQGNVGLIGLTLIRANTLLHKTTWKWSHRFASQIYTMAGFSAVWDKNILRHNYDVLLDGEDVSGRYANIHIANGPCNGGNMLSSPYAVPNDGLMDVIFTNKTRPLRLIRLLRHYQKGTYEKYSKIFHRRRGKKIEIHSGKTIYVELDGESFSARDIKIEVIPGGINFFAPDGIHFADYTNRAYKPVSREQGTVSRI